MNLFLSAISDLYERVVFAVFDLLRRPSYAVPLCKCYSGERAGCIYIG